MPNKEFFYQDPYPLAEDNTEYYQLTNKYVSVQSFAGKDILKIEPKALTVLAAQAIYDSQFFLRTAHQKQVAAILSDPEASENDKYVALQLLRNAEISAKGILPNCQDTGTTTIVAKKASKFGLVVTTRSNYHGVFIKFSSKRIYAFHKMLR